MSIRTAVRLAAGAALALLLALPAHAQPEKEAANRMVSRKVLGPWTVGGWVKPDHTGYCVAERQLTAPGASQPYMSFGIIKQGQVYGLSIASPKWELTPQAIFPVSLSAGPTVDGDVRAVALNSKLVQIAFGNDHALIARLATAPAIEIKTSSTVLRLPLDEFAAAYAEVEACASAIAGRKVANR
jgi:hypothetical protein